MNDEEMQKLVRRIAETNEDMPRIVRRIAEAMESISWKLGVIMFLFLFWSTLIYKN